MGCVLAHLQMLEKNGFSGAQRIFEAGPGRNIGTSLLWWANEMARISGKKEITIVLWDVYTNVKLWKILGRSVPKTC